MKEVEEKNIKFVSTVGDLDIWLGIVGVKDKKLEKKKESIRETNH